MENLYPHWNIIPPIDIPPTYSVIGYSVAAQMTGFYIPEIGIALDIGVISSHSPNLICITHGHADHCKQLYDVIVDTDSIRPIILVPQAIKDQVYNYIQSQLILSTQNLKPKVLNKITLTPVKSNTREKVCIKGKYWMIDIIYCYHTVPTVGYGFSECRTRLREKYKHIQKEDFIKLKKDLNNAYINRQSSNYDSIIKQIEDKYEITVLDSDFMLDNKNNIRIDEDYEAPIFCFLGDTSERVFENSILDKYPVIFVECTYLHNDKDVLDKAKKKRHIHWNKLEPIIRARQKQKFILFHFSAIYKSSDILSHFEKYRNSLSTEYLPNMCPWVRIPPKAKSMTSLDKLVTHSSSMNDMTIF